MNKVIEFLRSQHKWMSYEEAFALVEDSYLRHKDQDKYGGMTKSLVGIDIGIFGRSSEYELKNKLAFILEYREV